MALRGWSWDAAIGPAGQGDRPLLEALEAAIPDETVEATIEATGTRERRRRRLPTQLVVTLVVALGLWASESMRHVSSYGWKCTTQSRRRCTSGLRPKCTRRGLGER
jgi:Insertion element 4 transposase N-terminal